MITFKEFLELKEGLWDSQGKTQPGPMGPLGKGPDMPGPGTLLSNMPRKSTPFVWGKKYGASGGGFSNAGNNTLRK